MYIVFQSRNWSTFCHIRGLRDLKNSKVIKVAFTSPISLDEDKKTNEWQQAHLSVQYAKLI